MAEIKYSIRFLTYWHAGSGLSSGAQADAVVIKDENGLPYFPGKTLKGIFRDSYMTLLENRKIFQNEDTSENENVPQKEVMLFGQKNILGDVEIQPGHLFFSNAELPEKEILKNQKKLIPPLYDMLASTEINEKGVAENTSLRVIEVCVPVTLEGSICGFSSESEAKEFSKVFNLIKSIGAHRNRGLGRCTIQILAIQ